MALVPYNICQGAATVYTGAFGTTEPADSRGGHRARRGVD